MGTYFPTLTNTATLLADCDSFRTFVSAANQAAALEKIHYLMHDVNSDEYPFAAVTYMEGGSYQLSRETESPGIQAFGNPRTVNIVLEDRQEYSAATEQAFMEVVSNVIANITELSYPGGSYVLIDVITVSDDAVSYVQKSKVFQAVIAVEPRS